jgi:hypothetical protein
MDRKYFKVPIDELEALVKENLDHLQILGEIRDELTFRATKRGKQLLREVEGVLDGRMSRPEDQLDLI